MEDGDDFEEVFGSQADLSYPQKTIDQILRNRRSLENELFFDKLFTTLGLGNATKAYPPRSHADLRSLYTKIISSSSPDHHKCSLVYYLLRDLSKPRLSPQEYARTVYLPPKYHVFLDGLWYLDHLQIEESLPYLTSPALTPTFPAEILYTLCRHAPATDPSLPLAYYHAVSPPLSSSLKTLTALFTVYCRASIPEAYLFARSFPSENHRALLEQLITFVHADAGGDLRVSRAEQLIGLPLDEEEEGWMEDYLKEGKGRGLFGAKDTLIMRGLARGERGDWVLGLVESMRGKKVDGLSWDVLGEGMRAGYGSTMG
ncbi:hypothetical protein MMC25_002274 [Agyrium rufum]|nr:hypothetical protein [Agyrium rufum]